MKRVKLQYIIAAYILLAAPNVLALESILDDTYISTGIGYSTSANKSAIATRFHDPDNFTKQRLKSAEIFKVAAGKYLGDFRTEIEHVQSSNYNFSKHLIDPALTTDSVEHKLNVKHKTLFLNAFYHFNNLNTYAEPYIGAGIGHSQNTTSAQPFTQHFPPNTIISTVPKVKKNELAYNITAGVIYKVDKKMSIDLSYRFMDLGKIGGTKVLTDGTMEDISNITGRLQRHVVMAGIIYKF